MARPRKELGDAADAMIRILLAKGGTVESITAALRAGPAPAASPATVGRRMAEVRQSVNEGRSERREAVAGGSRPALVRLEPAATDSEPALPQTPEEIPEGASLADYDRWIVRAERMADDAEVDGDLKAIANAGRLVGFFMAEKRKATPKPVADPNEHPDYVALGAQVEERFLKMIDSVLEEM